jgi:mannose-6-phosphate isomerase-like protein (cupin superfamily)
MFEIYLVAKGTAIAVVNEERIVLKEGDLLVVEPKEHHTFLESSEDYLHFVIHSQFKEGDKIIIK